jgi:5-methylcytosine-specific restriction protein A
MPRLTQRPDFRERGYDGAWDRLSRDFKARHPWCLGCWRVGLETPTEFADHIVPLSFDRSGLLDPSNLQPACRWHHDHCKRTLELRCKLKQVSMFALRLDSPSAITLTLQRYPVPVGDDGYPLFKLAPSTRPYPWNL